MKSYFVIDVESVGLHGEGFAVAGGVYLENGAAQWEFSLSCPTDECKGTAEDRLWVKENVPALEITHRSPKSLREAFWKLWIKAKFEGALLVAECGWPVEARFLIQCVQDSPSERNWEGPYPLYDVASLMLAKGLDPMKIYERTESEKPAHNPLCDARLSARLLAECMK